MPFSKRVNNEIAKIQWRNFKIFARTAEPISTKLGTKHPWLKVTFQLLNNRFTFKELENDVKNILWRIRFFWCIVHLQKAPITASSENMPDSLSCAYRRKYYLNIYFMYIFKPNILSGHIRNKIIIKNTHDSFLVNIWNNGKNLQEQQQKCWNDVIFGQLSWFSWTLTIISFF